MSVFRDLVHTERATQGSHSATTVELLSCIEARCRPSSAWSTVKESLHALAGACASTGSGSDSDRVLEWLFDEAGFRGNRTHYGASSNSMLSEVLSCRRGIPISLCVVAQSVLAELGYDSHLIGLPGHVVLELGQSHHERYVDCFNGGRRLSSEQCTAMVAVAGAPMDVDRVLRPMSSAHVALRTLNNLVNSFVAERDATGLARAAALRLTVPMLGADDVRSTMALLAPTN